jgi:hypothetical protein
MPWLNGDFLPEFAPEWAGSYLLSLQKPGDGIHGITPVDIWGRVTGHDIVQATQQTSDNHFDRGYRGSHGDC